MSAEHTNEVEPYLLEAYGLMPGPWEEAEPAAVIYAERAPLRRRRERRRVRAILRGLLELIGRAHANAPTIPLGPVPESWDEGEIVGGWLTALDVTPEPGR